LVYIYENPVDISQAQALVHLAAVVGTGRQLVADQLAAAAGENRRAVDKHARYYGLLLAESHRTRRLFGNMLRRIAMLASPAA